MGVLDKFLDVMKLNPDDEDVYKRQGLTWYHAKLGILWSLQKLYERNLVDKSRMC